MIHTRALGLFRRAWRRSRSWPVTRNVVRVGDAMLWAFTMARSGDVDGDYVAAQLGRRSMSRLEASLVYAFGGFRRGLSVKHDFDDVYAAPLLPEAGRVPAFYSFLRNTVAQPLWHPYVPAVTREQALRTAAEWGHGNAHIGVAPSPAPDDVVVVVVASGPDSRLADRLNAALSFADHVIVVGLGLHMAEWLAITALSTSASLSARLFPAGANAREAVLSLLPRSGRVVAIDPRVMPDLEQMRALVEAIRPGRTVVPVEQAPDDTVHSAGGAVIGQVRVPLFRGLPIEDVRRIGESFEAPHSVGLTFSAAAPFDPRMPVLVDPQISVRLDPAAPGWPDQGIDTRTAGEDSDAARSIYLRAGFEAIEWNSSAPSLRWISPRVRWAVKVASLAGPVGDVWGDTHFGEALADALRRRGHDAVVDRREAALRETSRFDDVHVIVRGPTRLHPPSHGVRVLWIISHPHEITQEELDEFDLVFAASERWANEASRRFDREIFPLLECTDATRFRPRGLPRSNEIVFVGKSRDVPRRVVIAPVEAGVPVRVYGPDWSAYIPPAHVVAPFVPLSRLPEMYETAGVVLNDQWAEMKEAGFPAMRPFDVVAAGGRVLSEYVDGLENALGPGVVTYRLEAELVALLKEGDLDRLFPSDALLRENAERVRREHSFDARAAVLEEAVLRRGPGVDREPER